MSKKISTPQASFITNAVSQVLTGQVIDKPLRKNHIIIADDVPVEGDQDLPQAGMFKNIMRLIGESEDNVPSRLAFVSDPNAGHQFHSVYKDKVHLTPDKLLKSIARRDDLVASIVQHRSNQISSFGRPRPDRFSKGFIFETRKEAEQKINNEQNEVKKLALKADLQSRKQKATRKLMMCGESKGWFDEDRLTFSQYLLQSTRNAVTVGRIATEVLYTESNGNREFHSFRVIDAGTIYRARPQQGENQAAAAIRRQARQQLRQINGEKNTDIIIPPQAFMRDEFAWIQVIDDQPIEAFRADECLVHNFYPADDIELDGYPITPIDTALSAILTHLSISTHNRLYFQNGRASRGMLVINSDDMDQRQLGAIRQQFNASINSVEKSFRMPVFSLGMEDKISWQAIDTSARDGEFQNLADMNAKVIFAAFQMSPEEIPAWAGLARGTSSQSLSESNNEYQTEVARDAGIRPILAQFEDFINHALMPLIDPVLAEMAVLKLVGLDAETAEKESIRRQQDMLIHMTTDEVLESVEKPPLGEALGGRFLLNSSWQAQADKYLTVGFILEKCFGVAGAASNPELQYRRDPFWFQQQALLDQRKAAVQAQQAQEEAMQQQQQQGDSQQGDAGGEGDNGAPGQKPVNQDSQQAKSKLNQDPNSLKGPAHTDMKQVTDDIGKDPSQMSPMSPLSSSLDEAMATLMKSEEKQKKIQDYQQNLEAEVMAGWTKDAKETIEELTGFASKFAPKKKGT